MNQANQEVSTKDKELGIKDYLNPKNWRNYVEGNLNFHKWSQNLSSMPMFNLEQYIFRAYLCRECLINTKCKGCGCPAPALFFAPNKIDPKGAWPKFYKDAIEWNNFKNSSEDFKKFNQLLKEANVNFDSPVIFSFISSIPRNTDDESIQEQHVFEEFVTNPGTSDTDTADKPRESKLSERQSSTTS